MKELSFSYEGSPLAGSALEEAGERLIDETEAMNEALKKGYDCDHASLNLPDDRNDSLKEVLAEKKDLKPECLVVVGIGGSSLGSLAVQEAVLGRYHNLQKGSLKILYADTVDAAQTKSIMEIVKKTLDAGSDVIINGISKSGTTTETIANFQVLVKLLEKYKTRPEDYVVVTTDPGSRFWGYASDHKYSILEVPHRVGGRYSVFSAVGLFPLGLAGLNTGNLLLGAKEMRGRCLNPDFWENPAALSAAHIYLHYLKKRNIYNLFLFSPDLESTGKWYRQLMGESVGKQFDKGGQEVFRGITPTVAVGSTDLHSMAQLYLGGPHDKYTTFVEVEGEKANIKVSDDLGLAEGIKGKGMDEIMKAILEGVKIAYGKADRPYSEVVLPDKKEASMGQFLQYKMMEMMYLGCLLDVNPFDQPNVESYKSETRKILSR